MDNKHDRFVSIIKDLASRFLSMESNRTSLITVTNVEVTDKADRATILFTVLPIEKEKDALDFTKRQRSAFKEFVKENSRLMRIPFFDFEIDKGEKNRQKIDGLINQQ